MAATPQQYVDFIRTCIRHKFIPEEMLLALMVCDFKAHPEAFEAVRKDPEVGPYLFEVRRMTRGAFGNGEEE